MAAEPKFKGWILAISLFFNAVTGLVWYVWAGPDFSGPKMSCREALDEIADKQATRTFAGQHGNSLAETHAFLRASGFHLRNIDAGDQRLTFVYIADNYREVCGRFAFPGIDTSIVRVVTNVQSAPEVISVQ
jgi:hypothetical protein